MSIISRLFGSEQQPLRARMGEAIKALHDQAVRLHQQDLAQSLSDFRETIFEPFLFVIVGEVKTGKSSFINALLDTGEEVVEVAPDPCTDTIQQVLYGETEETVELSAHQKKIFLPVEILKKISIVDTPGTNTISEHHQEITEHFVPRSDLVVFVFEAKNPYRQSAWEFFQYIHQDWHKKIVFVLQQSDLMEPDDLVVNIEGLRKYAIKQGIEAPEVFALSAKQELNGQKEASGFAPLREYIRENITSADAVRLKLQSNLESASLYHEKLNVPIEEMARQLSRDQDFRQEVSHTLTEQQERSHKQIDQLVERMLSDYDRITGQAKGVLQEELGVLKLTGKSFQSIFNKSASPQKSMEAFTTDLEKKLRENFDQRANDGIEDIADSIRQMAQIIELKIKSGSILNKPHSDVFGDISERRRMVLRELKDNFGEFLQQTENFAGKEIMPQASAVSPNLAAGSGIAVIGIALTAMTTIPALDITGGIMSAVGVLFAGGTILMKRGRIIRGFAEEINKGRAQLEETITDKLKAYVAGIRNKIDGNFEEFDTLLMEQETFIASSKSHQSEIKAQLDHLSKEITGE